MKMKKRVVAEELASGNTSMQVKKRCYATSGSQKHLLHTQARDKHFDDLNNESEPIWVVYGDQ
jgi:hypothetical protein